VLVIRFGPSDLGHVRFAISPLVELERSLRALDDPEASALHLPWIAATRRQVADLDLGLLRALAPSGVYTPDFIHPPPTSAVVEFEQELAAMTSTPPDCVRHEIRRAYRRDGVPAVLERFLADPVAAVASLAELLREYWRRALEPHWDRLRSLLEGDVLYRARRMADVGTHGLFADIHPELSFDEGELRIEKRFEFEMALGGRGLLFVPSAFVWPRLIAITHPPWQPTLMYPTRGVATLWGRAGPGQLQALGALLGERRASVLEALEAPRSTTELARRLGVSTGSISQHLGVLRTAGLVDGHRVGRIVLYVRSAMGDKLVAGG
jgi:hypothetical protein